MNITTENSGISTKKAWLIILVSLIDDVIILALVVLAVWYFKVSLPLWAWIGIGLALGGFIFVRTWVVLPSLRRKKVTGAEGMIGLECEAVERLAPFGVVRVEGEYWKAKSVDGDIVIGEVVEVTGLSRLTLEVKRKIVDDRG